MKNKILQTAKKHRMFKEGMHIIIGLSGGPDSVCLFDVLRDMSADMNFKLYAVHVNHGLRPIAADEDEEYVKKLCADSGVPCYVTKVDCSAMAKQMGMTSEEAGRKARYDAFAEAAAGICQNQGTGREDIAIALAHNAGDQAETILFRILRGTGTDGLYGIPYTRKDENGFKIVRPLLDVERNEIEEYCAAKKLSPKVDLTNGENIYTRNKIRNMLIPYIKENFNENIIETLNRLGKVAATDRDYLLGETVKAYRSAAVRPADMETYDVEKGGAAARAALDVKHLLTLHRAIRLRVYTMALKEIGVSQNMTYAQADGIDGILHSESPSAMYDLTGSVTVRREYDKIVFVKGEEQSSGFNGADGAKAAESSGAAASGWKLYETTRGELARRVKGGVYGAFEGVSLGQLSLRTRKKGDRIATAAGTKKLQDFFVDEKVPKAQRDRMLLLTKGSDVLWILPSDNFAKENLRKKGRFSADYKVSERQNRRGTGPEDTGAPHEDTIIILEKL